MAVTINTTGVINKQAIPQIIPSLNATIKNSIAPMMKMPRYYANNISHYLKLLFKIG